MKTSALRIGLLGLAVCPDWDEVPQKLGFGCFETNYIIRRYSKQKKATETSTCRHAVYGRDAREHLCIEAFQPCNLQSTMRGADENAGVAVKYSNLARQGIPRCWGWSGSFNFLTTSIKFVLRCTAKAAQLAAPKSSMVKKIQKTSNPSLNAMKKALIRHIYAENQKNVPAGSA